jgi:hypothetical protein
LMQIRRSLRSSGSRRARWAGAPCGLGSMGCSTGMRTCFVALRWMAAVLAGDGLRFWHGRVQTLWRHRRLSAPVCNPVPTCLVRPSPRLCAPREVVLLRTWRQDREDGTYVILYQSVEHRAVPRAKTGGWYRPVRVEVQVSVAVPSTDSLAGSATALRQVPLLAHDASTCCLTSVGYFRHPASDVCCEAFSPQPGTT